MQARTPNPAFRWLRTGLLLLPLLMGATLVAGAHSNQRRIHEAAELLVRGQADWILRALTETLRGDNALLDPNLLNDVYGELHGDGLEYIALVESNGSIVLEAGTCTSRPIAAGRRGEPLQITQSRGRVIVTARLLVRRPRRRAPRDSGLDTHRLPDFVAFEFRPLIADRLRTDAERTFVVSVAAAAVLTLIAGILWWQLKRRERLAEAQERERRLAQLGEMSAVLAHEIRNPLASLKGQAQLLVEKLPEGRERKKASRIVEEALRLEALSQTLLDFVRSGNIQRKAIDSLDLLRNAAEVAAPGRVRISTKGAVDRDVLLDPLRMHQVLVNLLQNADQASAGERPIEALLERTERRLRMEIRDYGPGLPPGEEGKVFDAFQTSKTHGTGLGLAIARRIVELHDGTLLAHNDRDGGAVFVLEIPC